jgi:ubiquinone/menaquinone biosynthesis C-methylase UbiE
MVRATRWWDEHVVPRLVDASLGNEHVAEWRARTCAGLHGRVLEIGFGSGFDVAHYPSAVGFVAAVEPSELAWRRAQPRIAASPVTVRLAGRDAQRLELPDASHDAAVSAFTLCTVPDPLKALREVRRVLVDGGRFHFVEHGLAPDDGVVRWQRRLTPVHRAVCGGCHLDRRIDDLVEAAGFRLESLERFYAPGPRAARPFGAVYLGRAATA